LPPWWSVGPVIESRPAPESVPLLGSKPSAFVPSLPVPLPPGPIGRARVAMIALLARDGILAAFARMTRDYGPLSRLRLPGQTMVYVADPALVEQILVTRQREFVRDVGAAVVRDLLGEGLLTTEDPVHLARRRLMQPAFSKARVMTYAGDVIAASERVTSTWRDGDVLDIGRAMTRLTLDAVGTALVGADLRDDADAIASVLSQFGGRGSTFAFTVLLVAPLLAKLSERGGGGLFFRKERKRLEAILAPIVSRARAADGDDLVATLARARGDDGFALDDVALRSELVTLVLAGHETTSTALTWAWYLLALHPSAERRFHAELDAVVGERDVRVEDVARLPYTAAVFAEAMRLHPPVPAFARRPIEDIELGGYAIPAGTSIYVSPALNARDPHAFPGPAMFRPERWLDGDKVAKFAAFPFGGGSKRCIGEPFAELEGILALASIGRRFRFVPTNAVPVEAATGALQRPSKSIIVQGYERHGFDRDAALVQTPTSGRYQRPEQLIPPADDDVTDERRCDPYLDRRQSYS